MAISPTNGLVFHSAVIGGMNARRFDDFLAQTRLNLDPDAVTPKRRPCRLQTADCRLQTADRADHADCADRAD